MKVTFLGLSCFLIESKNSSRLLIDPYNDSPQFSLGIKLPDNLQSDLFLVSHPDEDHSCLKSSWTRKDFDATFPHFRLTGTLVREFGRDLNIAYAFTIDGVRFLHLADNAWDLTQEQIDEIGPVDILFISPPKVSGSLSYITNIKKLNPRLVILSHHIPPTNVPETPTFDEIKSSLKRIILQDWVTNPHADEETVERIATIFLMDLSLEMNLLTIEQYLNRRLQLTTWIPFITPLLFTSELSRTFLFLY
jgi:L-ascorbate metabolism protein UlaG (beta-lactamase superfamily)